MKEIKFIDLFAGIGGFRLALESEGAKCVFSSEWDKHAQNVYKKNFHETPLGDITKIHEKEIPAHNVLCAGFPCQPFSISGKQNGFDDIRGTLFFDIARIIKYHTPEIIILENVKNFINHDKGKTLNTVIETLKKLNYSVQYELLNSSFYGIPQSRARVFIVGISKDINNSFFFPKPTYKNITLNDVLLPNKDCKNFAIKRNDIHIDKDKTIIKPDMLGNYPLKPIRIGHVNKAGQGERIYHPLGHAITLSAYGGGAGAKTGLYFIDGIVRKLHPHECKRLMGFPEEFIIDSSITQSYKQFGNSIVVDIVKEVFLSIMEATNWLMEKKISKSGKEANIYSEIA